MLTELGQRAAGVEKDKGERERESAKDVETNREQKWGGVEGVRGGGAQIILSPLWCVIQTKRLIISIIVPSHTHSIYSFSH